MYEDKTTTSGGRREIVDEGLKKGGKDEMMAVLLRPSPFPLPTSIGVFSRAFVASKARLLVGARSGPFYGHPSLRPRLLLHSRDGRKPFSCPESSRSGVTMKFMSTRPV